MSGDELGAVPAENVAGEDVGVDGRRLRADTGI
jgi:hypothetical protein